MVCPCAVFPTTPVLHSMLLCVLLQAALHPMNVIIDRFVGTFSRTTRNYMGKRKSWFCTYNQDIRSAAIYVSLFVKRQCFYLCTFQPVSSIIYQKKKPHHHLRYSSTIILSQDECSLKLEMMILPFLSPLTG